MLHLLTPLTNDRLSVLLFKSEGIRYAQAQAFNRAYLPLLLADPQLVESAQTGEDAPSEPPAISSLDGVSGRMDFDLQMGQSAHR